MVTTASCFAQVLSLVDRRDFARAVREHEADKGAKDFKCWHQFVAMLFCQMGSVNSLREITGGLATAMGKVVHLGLREAPKRSTLSYANGHRPWQVYQTVFEKVLVQSRALAKIKGRKCRSNKASAPRTYAGTSGGPCVGFANGCNADAPEMLTGMWTRAVRLTEYTTKQRKLKSSKSWRSAKNL